MEGRDFAAQYIERDPTAMDAASGPYTFAALEVAVDALAACQRRGPTFRHRARHRRHRNCETLVGPVRFRARALAKTTSLS